MKIKELIKDTIEDTYIDHETHTGDLRDDCSECFKVKQELSHEKLQAEANDRDLEEMAKDNYWDR